MILITNDKILELVMVKRGIFLLLCAVGLVISVCGNSQAVVVEDSLMVTDVTPVQFCVVWATSEPASASLNLYVDPQGTTPYTEAVVVSESAAHPPAEDNGVMKVKVMGLKPDTEYFFRSKTIAKSNNAVYLSVLESVRTEKSSMIVRNDILAQKVGIGGTDPQPALGMLVIASVDNASYPLTGWVGDGVPEQWGMIDTNNFFDWATHVNLELNGGEVINLTLFGGSLGSVETQDIVPQESGSAQSMAVAAYLPDAEPEPPPPPPPPPQGRPRPTINPWL